jgi:predicted nucleic acid-binding Zn ribbon protein
MNTQQPEALRLANFLDVLYVRTPDRIQNCVSAATELRRLHSVNAELLEALNRIASIELQMNGGDWDEITEAQAIAEAAIAKSQE